MSEIFREKSLERVQSPEQLNDYIKVTTPRVWLVLIAVILLLLGVIVWGIFGRVTVQTPDDETKTVAPISFVTN